MRSYFTATPKNILLWNLNLLPLILHFASHTKLVITVSTQPWIGSLWVTSRRPDLRAATKRRAKVLIAVREPDASLAASYIYETSIRTFGSAQKLPKLRTDITTSQTLGRFSAKTHISDTLPSADLLVLFLVFLCTRLWLTGAIF